MTNSVREVREGGIRIAFPARGTSTFAGQRKPLARVWVGEDESEDAPPDLEVPVVVARAITKALREGSSVANMGGLDALVGPLMVSCARSRAVELVDRREYSTHDLVDRLVRDGFQSSTAAQVVGRLAEVGAVSDARYADTFVRSKIAVGWGERRIERELARHGIQAQEALPGWPYDYLDPDDEVSRARDLVARKSIPAKNPYQKLVRFLISRGFSYSTSIDAVKSHLEASGVHEDV